MKHHNKKQIIIEIKIKSYGYKLAKMHKAIKLKKILKIKKIISVGVINLLS